MYGLEAVENAVAAMREMISTSDVSIDVLLHFLLWSDGNVSLALDRFLQPQSLLPDFNRIVGYEWYSDENGKLNQHHPDWPMYDASFPPGPMGITVENIHEVSESR